MEIRQEKYVNPFTDYGFKRLFGEEWSKEILLDFLNELLVNEQGKIKDLSYLKADKLGTSEESRKAIFDLYCENERGEKFIVEIQKSKQRFFKDRTVYYSTFPIREQAKRGADWNFELNAVYTVAILDFVFDSDKHEVDKFRYDVKLTDIETCKVFYDKLTFIYLEMPKFTKGLKNLTTRFEKWLYLFKNLHKLDRIPEELREKVFEKVFKIAEIARFTPEEAEEYEDSLKSYRDLKNSLDTAREEGLKEGRKEGREEGRKQLSEEFVMNMYKKGVEVNQIAEFIGLTIQDVEKIIENNS